MIDFAYVPEFWLGSALGLPLGMVLMAGLLFALDASEFRRLDKQALPPRSGKGYRWPEAGDGIVTIDRPRSRRSELRSRPR
ncbi:hypothetical protein WCE55_02310 [Luteimonas sp. MJ293]|uniref:hypothetical protein n=1 Tax=Luteimonas sp. MJ146 TaxID=3129240 RepID=UPI0031BA96E4